MTTPTPNPRAELRAALADVDAAYDAEDMTDEELGNMWAERALRLADRATKLLAWMDAADVDPGDPPSCGCGGHHWVHPGDGPADGETEGSTVATTGHDGEVVVIAQTRRVELPRPESERRGGGHPGADYLHAKGQG